MPIDTSHYARVYLDEMPIRAGSQDADPETTSTSTISATDHNRALMLRRTASPSAWDATRLSTEERSYRYPEEVRFTNEWTTIMQNTSSVIGRWSANAAQVSTEVSMPTTESYGSSWVIDDEVVNFDYGAMENRLIADMALQGEFRYEFPETQVEL